MERKIVIPEDPRSDPLLTTDEVAAICRTTASTIRYWRYRGLGPPGFRAGRRVLYPRSGVVAWLEAQAANEVSR